MAQTYNILMNRFNGTDHDTLLPKNSLNGTSDPTSNTKGFLGQLYINIATTPKKIWQCTNVNGSVYSWNTYYTNDEILSYNTQELYGFDGDSTPDDAFSRLATNMVATRKTYPIKAGNTVAAGNVVDVVGGEVQKSWQANPNTKNVINSSVATTQFAVCKLNETYSIVCYSRQTVGTARLSLNSTGGSAGGADYSSSIVTFNSCARLTDSKFIAQYVGSGSMNSVIGTVSGKTITFGSSIQISTQTTNSNTIIPLSETSFLSIYNRSGLKSKVCTVSGTTITTGTEYMLSGSTDVNNISATRLPDGGTYRRVCVCYSDNSNKGTSVTATINASNVVTWGTPVAFEAATSSAISVCADGSDSVVVVYLGNSAVYARVLTISGYAITPKAPTVIQSSSSDYNQITKQGNSFVALSNATGGGKASLLVRSGTTLTKSYEFTFNSANTYYLASASLSSNQLMATFADAGNSNYGTATLLTVQGDQIAGSFTDTSSQAIALQSGTSPQSIDIIFDGVAPLAGITAGTQITSPGVQGYAPQDGWLWVRPEWEQNYGTKVVSGTYIGTGTYGAASKTTLSFDGSPMLVVVSQLDDIGDLTLARPKAVGLGTKAANQFVLWGGHKVEWYNSQNAAGQLNTAGTTYSYIAITER